MSLKRRNYIALILLFLAALCWTFGQRMLTHDIAEDANAGESSSTTTGAHTSTVTQTSVTNTRDTAENLGEGTTVESTLSSTEFTQSNHVTEKTGYSTERLFGYILSFISIVAAVIAIIVLYQKNPICGPDGAGIILAILATVYNIIFSLESTQSSIINILRLISGIVGTFAVLLSIRELIGWIRARFSLSWCLVHRIAKRCATPQMSLLIFIGWIFLPWVVLASFLGASVSQVFWVCVLGYLTASAFGFLCLWKYGTDLNHFKKQLDNYQQGKPIIVRDGAFSQTEAQLLDVQAQHEEAVRTAVASERFKVELISNVSHDLRTPLTSILGYSELLQKESLSSEGQEQLRRLHQKAGYMNDLVEALFELTKVSSGVVECKKDEIDLIRLLEQTIGLVDDQLVSTGLTVKRNYCADSISVITDGARMHQVFANLLGNAIKYALAGTRIYLEVKETEMCYHVRMMNTASYEMDFKPDEIMQRFARGDKARSTKGSGLGLAIAQTYTESVGGSFRVILDGDQFNAIVELPKTERNL
ncbi:MAG: HAMP domain-containing histidine kinase [Clostridia bacterium]|nr:HAMP domain-containing histidine kinase [Clostridia bacterium]